jgi:hypothetical protein
MMKLTDNGIHVLLGFDRIDAEVWAARHDVNPKMIPGLIPDGV